MIVNQLYPKYATQEEFNRQASISVGSIIKSLPIVGARNISGAATADSDAAYYFCDATGGSFTVTLPPSSAYEGRSLFFKKLGAANTVTIDGYSSETIDGSTTYALSTQYDGVWLYSDGTQWYVLSTV